MTVSSDTQPAAEQAGTGAQRFRVAEALTEDTRKGIVRVSERRFEGLGTAIGATVAVVGNRTTYARLYPALPSQCDESDILMDGITRANASVTPNAEVSLQPAILRDARSVVLRPVDPTSNINGLDKEESLTFLRRYLIGIPIVTEDKVAIKLFSSRDVSLRVVGTAPPGPVTVTSHSLIQIQRADTFESSFPIVTYEDIGGLSEQIRLVREITELPLRYPEAFARLGIEPPKGILLYGPPGTGKTLMARAVAAESGIYFIHVNGPEVMNKYYGESEARLREVFDEARRKAPSILFLDELDALAPKRSEVVGDVEKRVVGQLLALMDGLVSRGQVVVIGATNMPSLLDPALRRPGRFDREIFIPIPDKAGRLEVFQIHTRGMALDDDVNLETLAGMAHGYAGADIASLCREAGMLALRRIVPQLATSESVNRDALVASLRVTMRDFVEAARSIQPSVTREFFTEIPDIAWQDIGGLAEIKRKLEEMVIWPLRNPEQAVSLGASPARSLLFSGPSGTGKTLTAKALAREAGVNLISVLGPSLFSKWFGESEKGLRELFQTAKQASPCVLCIDEIDALAATRVSHGATAERLVSQLLMELDGLGGFHDLVVIGTTNRRDLIDPAFLRPGRFDLVIEFPMPGLAEREEVFRVHLRGKTVVRTVDAGRLGALTKGFTAADIYGVCKRAAFLAVGSSLSGGTAVGCPTGIAMPHFLRAIGEVREQKHRRRSRPRS